MLLGINANKVLHVVGSIDSGFVYIKTAHIPDTTKWEKDWKTLKEESLKVHFHGALANGRSGGIKNEVHE